VAALLVALLSLAWSPPAYEIDGECVTVYFLNALYVENSSYSGRLYLETPVNLSLGGVNQTVRTIASRGVLYDPDERAYVVNVSEGTPVYAYVLLEVRVCSLRYSEVLNVLKTVMLMPQAFLTPTPQDLGEELRGYLGAPPQAMVSVVSRDFEEWLKAMPWYYAVGNLSSYPLVLAVYAAKFIYGGTYIRYSPSLLPRTTEEVVERKEGDCDDMSRVLLSLLWYYGIPATIAYGFVAIPGYTVNSTVGSFTYMFSNGGPHAFVLAYVVGYGWLSLDLLAGSLLVYPAAIWGLSSRVLVERREVEEAEELHRAIVGRQLMASLDLADLQGLDIESLETYINVTFGLQREVPPEASPTYTVVEEPRQQTAVEVTTTTITAVTSPEPGRFDEPAVLAVAVLLVAAASLLALLVVLRGRAPEAGPARGL